MDGDGSMNGRVRGPNAGPLPLLAMGCLGVLAVAADSAGQTLATLEVAITGFDSARGELAIALFDSTEGYATQTNAVRKAFLPIENGRSRWVLEDVPVGRYALIAYHDENGNREIDLRLLGIPKEPVGVSNDARGRFGPPSFDAASFEVSAPLTRHALELH